MTALSAEKRLYIKDMQPGVVIGDWFVVSSARQGTAKNGPFWTLSLKDRTGGLEAKLWSPQSQAFADIPAGVFAYVEGRTSTYNNSVQLTIDRLSLVPVESAAEHGLSLGDFVPAAERPSADMLADVEALAKTHLRDKSFKRFVKKVLGDEEIRSRLLIAPGAKAMHHAYAGGLLEHTLSVVELAMLFCDKYPRLDRDLLFAAALCHDLGKAWELSSGLSTDYTTPGRLVGHIVLVLKIVDPFLESSGLDEETKLHFTHIILSHHGEYEYGSPRRPKTAEAMALHYADNLDAKMNQIAGVFKAHDEPADSEEVPVPAEGEAEVEAAGPSGVWSSYIKGLDRFLYRPAKRPATENAKSGKTGGKGEGKDDGGGQCSLL